MINTRTASILFALVLGPTVGCGPKEPVNQVINEDGSVNPRQAFLAGVTTLKTPNRQGDIDYASAYENFSLAVTAKPDFTNAHYNAGWTAERLGLLDKAAVHYRSALELDSSNEDFLFALADVLTREGRGSECGSSILLIRLLLCAWAKDSMESLSKIEMLPRPI